MKQFHKMSISILYNQASVWNHMQPRGGKEYVWH